MAMLEPEKNESYKYIIPVETECQTTVNAFDFVTCFADSFEYTILYYTLLINVEIAF